jgi:hypothetical protein
LVGCLGFETRSVLIALADRLCNLGGIILAEASMIWVAELGPFKLYFGVCLPIDEKHGKTQLA